MARFHPLLVLLLSVLLVAPAAPLAAGTGAPAAPEAAITTFNVVRLSPYPTTRSYDAVIAVGTTVFLADNHYDSLYPPYSEAWVDEYDIANPYLPSGTNIWGVIGTTFSGMAAQDVGRGVEFAIAYMNQGWEGSASAITIGDTDEGICGVDVDYYTYGYAASVLMDDLDVWVGVTNGLTSVSFEEPVNEECHMGPLYPTGTVYAMARVGHLLYLGQYAGVRVVDVYTRPPAQVAFYPTPHAAYRIAVSPPPANLILVGTDYGLDIIDEGAGQIVTHYGPNDTVTVAADGTTAYVGTSDDLRVLDVSDPRAPVLIGAYADPNMDFERSLAFNEGLVHSPKGIFQYRPDLWLEAQSAGVAVNGTPLQSGSSRTIGGGDQVTLAAPGSAAAVKLRCAAGGAPETAVTARQATAQNAQEFTTAVINVVLEPELLGLWAKEACSKPQPLARLQTDPPALPLSLASGGVQLELPATAGAVKLDTTCAGSTAPGGTTFRAGHTPTAGVSRFVCLAGTLQVQPTAAGAPPLTLARGQFVEVTAAGAGPVGWLRDVYLPLALR
jgi:hypothetical protein